MLLALATACRRHGDEVVVRVLYSAKNPETAKLRQSEREFSFTDPRLRSGQGIAVTASAADDPAAQIAGEAKNRNFDLYVLKSAAELPDIPDLRKSMGDSFSICGQAVAYLPDWTNEERREGAARFLQYLSTHCR